MGLSIFGYLTRADQTVLSPNVIVFWHGKSADQSERSKSL
jgi:hypothetical protein